MQAPNLYIVAIVFIIALAIILSSAKKDEEKTREFLAQHPTTEHVMMQGEPHPGAWLLALLIAAVGIYIALPR